MNSKSKFLARSIMPTRPKPNEVEAALTRAYTANANQGIQMARKVRAVVNEGLRSAVWHASAKPIACLQLISFF